MSYRTKNITLTITMAVFLLAMFLANLFKPDSEYSDSERRILAKKPEFTKETLLAGSFMKAFETYTLDQFPLRDTFRSVKSVSEFYAFSKKENNHYYIRNGYLAKIEYPFSQAMQDHVVERFTFLNETYLKPNGITPYFVMVPDKSFFLANRYGYLSLDYESFEQNLAQRLPFMKTIDIKPLLSIEDYYKTDTHWRSEKLLDVANLIAETMNTDIDSTYQTITLDQPFYGVYYNQVALPVKTDSLSYVTSLALEHCTVSNLDTGKPVTAKVYDLEKVNGKDPYEMFLCGSSALVTIENPNAKSDKQLILFRDSFGSSIAPYFVEGYQKITLVDIRYVQSTMLSYFLDFENADVLFLYSTLLLNNSLALK